MKLTKFLSDQGYDLIEGPVRNYKPLQLWLKQGFNETELYYDNIKHAFKGDVSLAEIENPVLSINSSKKDNYGYNIGITVLEEVLKSLGIGTFEISTKIKSGKTVSISYDNSLVKEYAVGTISDYLSSADFKYVNPSLLKNANRNNILIITGTVFAKNLVVDIETDFKLNAALLTGLNEITDGKLDISMGSQTSLSMISDGNTYFPVAVKASRIDFERSRFKSLVLITDNRNIF